MLLLIKQHDGLSLKEYEGVQVRYLTMGHGLLYLEANSRGNEPWPGFHGSSSESSFSPPMDTSLFTSESVNEGHPDKICDQVSGTILDACLEQNPESKVACETCTKTNMVMVFGEITTKAKVDYEKIVRDTC
ncbi:hypothetical protein MLD38_000032 [Melastoma candidum]|uniref:Uncharacterized protein n=1 Tax=Melastoma candidum TaxID=119954 RepID=A0ACB9S8R1_9MYRT|nr:hypothetical protein MLD38_000032 [Melastoma candidum]